MHIIYYPTAFKGCVVLFSPMESSWADSQVFPGGGGGGISLGCDPENIRYRNFSIGRDAGRGFRYAVS